MAIVIDGRALATQMREELREKIKALGDSPGLAVIQVGENPASTVYVQRKVEACHAVGIRSWAYKLPQDVSEREVLDVIHTLNTRSEVQGILLQLPLPPTLSSQVLIRAIDPQKDVDGLHPENMGRLMIGDPYLVPCTPQGCLLLIKQVQKDLAGQHALVIGRSLLVGKPLIPLLLRENCTVTSAHSHTKNLPDLCGQADIVIAALGHPHFVQGKWLKPESIVIDVGITRQGDQILGDVDTDSALPFVKAITPVPGGVGPMTVACLLKNTLAAKRKALKDLHGG